MTLCYILTTSWPRSTSDTALSGIPDFLEMKKSLDVYEERMKKERVRLEQKEAELKSKEKHIDARVQEKEAESRKKMAAEEKRAKKKLKEHEDMLEAERRDWEEEKERVKQTKAFEKVITLNVGGTRYTTTLSTLTKYPDSMLGAMFSGRHDLPQQEDGSYFIDRDGEVFKYILMYLRDRDHCFNILYDKDLHLNRSSLPSPLEKPLLKQIAYEAQYFQVRELETKVLIILNISRYEATSISGWQSYKRYDHMGKRSLYTSYDLDYGMSQLQCYQYTRYSLTYTHMVVEHIFDWTCQDAGVEFNEQVSFDSCDLSGVTFRNCYFQKGISFEGCILSGTKFERVGGLVSHKVHFAPWQVAQADFEPELLQALKDNGCIY